MIKELADISHGWPQSEKFSEYEDWQKYLKEIALHFENCREEGSTELEKKENEAFEKLQEFRNKYQSREWLTISENPKYQKLNNDWFDLVKQVSQMREQEKNIAFDMLKEVFFSLWD